MAINFSQVKAITIPEGSVKQITDGQGNILWTSAQPVAKYKTFTLPLSNFINTFSNNVQSVTFKSESVINSYINTYITNTLGISLSDVTRIRIGSPIFKFAQPNVPSTTTQSVCLRETNSSTGTMLWYNYRVSAGSTTVYIGLSAPSYSHSTLAKTVSDVAGKTFYGYYQKNASTQITPTMTNMWSTSSSGEFRVQAMDSSCTMTVRVDYLEWQ